MGEINDWSFSMWPPPNSAGAGLTDSWEMWQ